MSLWTFTGFHTSVSLPLPPSIPFSPLHLLILFLDRISLYMCHASINGIRVIEQELSFGPDLLRQRT